ncbi:DUF2313 domain-containing protein [Escherichia coli]|nr:DUF2313 domain-containing protein [Escherichia coli]
MSRFSTDDYTHAMLNLLPSGIAWSRLPDSVQYRLIRGLAQAYQQSDADACALITGAFPETADALIDEWYDSLGLNDECGTQASITDQAQARKFILSKLLSTGGQSVVYFTELAATMGYCIRIREYRTPLCGFSWCGHLLSDDNRYNWTVVVAPSGDDVTTSRAYLECLFRRYAPAHTLVTFEWQSSYSAALSITWDNSTHVLSGELTADEGVVVSGVTVNVVIKSMSGQRYVATVTTGSAGDWLSEPEEDFSDGCYSVYAETSVDMPDDVTVPLRSEVLTVQRKRISVTGVSVSPSSLTLSKGESETLVVSVLPENAEDSSFAVTVNGSAVSAVDNGDGTVTVTGKESGSSEVAITTTDGGYTATADAAVSSYVAVTGVSVSPQFIRLSSGDSATVTVEVEPPDAENKRYSLSNSDVLVMDADDTGDGAFTVTGGWGVGTVTVTTADGGHMASVGVTVSNMKELFFSQQPVSLAVGESVTVSVSDESGLPVELIVEPYNDAADATCNGDGTITINGRTSTTRGTYSWITVTTPDGDYYGALFIEVTE